MKSWIRLFRHRFLSPIQEFIHDSRAVGITLIACTVIALILSNSSAGAAYIAFWEKEQHLPVAWLQLPHSFLHGINDGLMSLFFLLAGMEIRRELNEGELAGLQKATLPILAATGGMLIPALLYTVFNISSGYSRGWGIPMATDIAFSLGILSLLGSRAPFSLKILLTALAIIDDLGAILTIAIFYTGQMSWAYLAAAGGLFLLLLLLNRLKVKPLIIYFIAGILLWYCLLHSGVHATLAGVLLAFTLPMKRIASLEHRLHDPVSFIILPLFALANTAIGLPASPAEALSSPLSYGILAGLVLGKPLGIFLFSYISVKTGLAKLPGSLRWRHIAGMGMLAGIGFTMSIFIALLAFDDAATQTTAKLAILIASLLSGLAGYLFLRFGPAGRSAPKPATEEEEAADA